MRPEMVQGKRGLEHSPDERSGCDKKWMNRDMLIIESQRRKRQIKEGDRLSTPSPRQVRTLLERSNASAIRSMYKIQMDFPYSPGRTLDQRSQDALQKFQEQPVSETLPLPTGARFSPKSTRQR